MKPKNRLLLLKVHGHKYRRHFISEGYYCFYCGQNAQALDHVPPLALMDSLPYETRKNKKIPCSLLPVCNQCNSALLARNLCYVADRLLYLESYYEAKLKKATSFWSEGELQELGRGLQDYIKAKQEINHEIIMKIRSIQMRQIKTETFPVFMEEEDEECLLKNIK